MRKTNTFLERFLAVSLLMLFGFTVAAQDTLPRRALQLTGSYSTHGSGDMKGIGMGAEYVQYLTKKTFLNYNLRTTIHSSKDEVIIVNTPTGSSQDASIRFTTAGVQLGVDAGYSFVRTKVVSTSISLGGFVRYQSASNGSDGYSLYGPATTGLPLFLVAYANRTPQQTFALGGLLQLQLDVRVSKLMYVGLLSRFQTDTNGDAITGLGLAIGRRF